MSNSNLGLWLGLLCKCETSKRANSTWHFNYILLYLRVLWKFCLLPRNVSSEHFLPQQTAGAPIPRVATEGSRQHLSHIWERRCKQTAARWNTGLGSGQGQFLSRRVKLVRRPLRLLEDKYSQRQTGKLECRDRFLEDQIWGVNPVVTSEMATSTTWKKETKKTEGEAHASPFIAASVNLLCWI